MASTSFGKFLCLFRSEFFRHVTQHSMISFISLCVNEFLNKIGKTTLLNNFT